MKHCLFLFALLASTALRADFYQGGVAYQQGDFEAAAREFAPLAERGDHRAMYALGSLYASGLGVDKDLQKAYQLFYEAAQNGRADAMYKLGLMYEQGLGTKKNDKKALRYYQKSAKKGYPLSQFRFGLMYANGLGVKKNSITAYAWITIAAHHFIYESAKAETIIEQGEITSNKQLMLLFNSAEKDRITADISDTLQQLRQQIDDADVDKVRQKVVKLSQYRKQYHAASVRELPISGSIEQLFLPTTLY